MRDTDNASVIEFCDETHRKIYLEVDRLYHSCETSEGRCVVISDYIVRLLNTRIARGDCEEETM